MSRYDRTKSNITSYSGKPSIIGGSTEGRGVYEMANLESQPSISYGYGGERTLMKSIMSNCEAPYDS